MNELFLRVLSMSLSATLLAAAVLVVRPLLEHIKAPKWLICALWGVLALRLLLPFSFESRLSAVPEPVASGSVVTHYAHQHWNRVEPPAVPPVQPSIPDQPNPAVTQSEEHPEQTAPRSTTQVLAGAWLTGVGIMLAYALWSYRKVRRQVAVSVKEDGLWLCDHLQSPFILGFLRPRIYLPSDLSGADRAAVVAHERAHLARRDHWWKPLGFLLLALHWFNPVLWLCYGLLCRDIESACDERVIRDLDLQEKKAYSAALLSLSLPRRQLAACPLAFGEVGVKERVKNVLNYKKPAFWVVLAAVAAAVVLAVCFLSKPPLEGPEGPDGVTPLKEATRQYDRTTAVSEGALWVEEDGPEDLSPMEQFMRDAEHGKESFLRVVHYYTALDPEKYDPKYYEAHKNEYPAHYVTDIAYKDGAYTTQCYADGPRGKLLTQTYTYLIKDSGRINGKAFVGYLLSNDRNMTYQRYVSATLSSVYNSDPAALGSHVIFCKWGQDEVDRPAEQLAILAERKEEWMLDGRDHAAYAVTDLDRNGCLELIASYSQVSGHAPETHIWEVDLAQGKLNPCGNQGTENRGPLLKVPQDGVTYGDAMLAHSVIPAWIVPDSGKLCLEVTSDVRTDALHIRMNKQIASFDYGHVETEAELHKEFRVSGLESWYPGTALDVKYSDDSGKSITEEEYDNAVLRAHPTWLPVEVELAWVCEADLLEKSQEEVAGLLWGAWQEFSVVPLNGLQIEGNAELLYVPDFETDVNFFGCLLSNGNTINGTRNGYGFQWSADDEKVCKVDQNGGVTPLAVGKTTVRARYRGLEAAVPVEVKAGTLQSIELYNDVQFIPLDKSAGLELSNLVFSGILSDGEAEHRIELSMKDLKRPELVKWSLDGAPLPENQSVLKLDKPGHYLLTATVDGCSDTVKLIVFNPHGVKLTDPTHGTSFEVAVGTADRLSPEMQVGDDLCDVAWEAEYTCSAPNVLSVEPDGGVTGIAPGKVTVTASYLGQTLTYAITVVPKA